ncbi:hypothetical protein Tco_0542728 [Tanacetum coccineum]
MEPNKALIKDEEADSVDVHLYRSMIGSLMYLTDSRPDIMFAVCACARFQVTPKMSHLHVQTIVANSTIEAEYIAAANCCGQIWMKGQYNPLIPNPYPHLLNSTIKKPIIISSSYQPKKTHKPRTAIRTTKISQSSGPINLVEDETIYKEWEDIMERAATSASSLDAEHDSDNINKTQSIATLNESFPQGTDSRSGPRCQDTILGM